MTIVLAYAVFTCPAPSRAMPSGAEIDMNGMKQVRHLADLPPDVARLAGWQGTAKDEIADLERLPGTYSPARVSRWFLVGGVSSTYVLVAAEVADARTEERYSVSSYTFAGGKWVATGRTILSASPHTLTELGQLMASPESVRRTDRWQARLRQAEAEKLVWAGRPPVTRTTPATLRKTNINDIEVREIQAIVESFMPGAIVEISGVVDGCPCEDGAACSAQVWTAVYRDKRTASLQLSEIDGHWAIGPVQKWYMAYEKLLRTVFPDRGAYTSAMQALNDNFPKCASPKSDQQAQATR